jgi:hypothetical protein
LVSKIVTGKESLDGLCVAGFFGQMISAEHASARIPRNQYITFARHCVAKRPSGADRAIDIH